ncbi:phage holin family protein [Brevibacillus choshinensis]|uniref:Phage holin family protein n=1 Tax=Brevibacillus choshinensis TaxID=54911 RepID=A0ABX7FNP6_BRECH|nr:phage holin family protein [Brevibacillus choshinensis]QRG66922.1 phage holin family protein [Brevibacillus choshinensis]
MNETDLLALANQFLLDKALIVVVALLVIGVFLKKTPWIPDWSIPWILTGGGIGMAWGVLGAISVQATIQGILAAGIATLGHQLWKQTFEKREGDQ